MKLREIKVVPYQKNWPKMYAEEAKLLMKTFGHQDIDIEHIGSTAVPNLSAKPVVDIMLAAKSLTIFDQNITNIESLGYIYCPHLESQFPKRRFFYRRNQAGEGYHLHAVLKNSPFWFKHLQFRDILRSNPKIAKEYATLKQDLANQFRFLPNDYVNAKTDFINRVLRKYLKE